MNRQYQFKPKCLKKDYISELIPVWECKVNAELTESIDNYLADNIIRIDGGIGDVNIN